MMADKGNICFTSHLPQTWFSLMCYLLHTPRVTHLKTCKRWLYFPSIIGLGKWEFFLEILT